MSIILLSGAWILVTIIIHHTSPYITHQIVIKQPKLPMSHHYGILLHSIIKITSYHIRSFHIMNPVTLLKFPMHFCWAFLLTRLVGLVFAGAAQVGAQGNSRCLTQFSIASNDWPTFVGNIAPSTLYWLLHKCLCNPSLKNRSFGNISQHFHYGRVQPADGVEICRNSLLSFQQQLPYLAHSEVHWHDRPRTSSEFV